MFCCCYLDNLVNIGYISEKDWDDVSNRFDNTIEIDVPEDLLRQYYEEKLKDKYNMDFNNWYYDESICDDFDGLFGFRGWTPFLADVPQWSEMLKVVEMARLQGFA